jgi:hypothetical protein
MGRNSAQGPHGSGAMRALEWVGLLSLIRPGWLAGPAREEELVFLFPERIFYSTQKLKEFWEKYLETLENYKKIHGDRLGYLAQLLYWTL